MGQLGPIGNLEIRGWIGLEKALIHSKIVTGRKFLSFPMETYLVCIQTPSPMGPQLAVGSAAQEMGRVLVRAGV